MGRFFEVANGFEGKDINLPKRSTKLSAGYDFEAAEDVIIPSIWKAYTDLLERSPEHEECVDLDSLESFAAVRLDMSVELTSPEFFIMKKDEFIEGFKPTKVNTGIKAKMEDDEVLYLYNRSSNPKMGLILANGVGVGDADYYGNPGNDGHLMFQFLNFGKEDVKIKKGEKIGQGIFAKYLVTDNDNAEGNRIGGFGSTGK